MRTVLKRRSGKRFLAGLLAFVMMIGVTGILPAAKAQESKQVTVDSYSSGGAQDFAERWLFCVKLSDSVAEEANPSTGDGYYTGYNGLSLAISDGTDTRTLSQVEACAADYGKGELAFVVPYTELPAYDTVAAGDYTVTVLAGTITSSLATYVIKEDCVLEFNKTTGKWQKKSDASDVGTNQIKTTSLGEHGAQPDMSRWLFRFGFSNKIDGTAFSTEYTGLHVVVNNGTKEKNLRGGTVLSDENGGLALIVPYDSLPSYDELGVGVYTLTVKACEIQSGNTTYQITNDFTIRHSGGSTWVVDDGEEPGGVNIEVTVTLGNDDRNLAGNTTGGFYFTVDPADPLAYDTANWSINYAALEGGVYVNDTLRTDVLIKKVLANLYYVPLDDYGIRVKKDMKVKIDGIFGDMSHAVKCMPATFTYDGNGKWALAGSVEEEPLTEQVCKVYDLFDLLQVSTISIPDNSYYNLTDLKKTTNVGLKLHVNKTNIKSDTQDYGIGFAKKTANNIWVESGYQLKVSPALGRILILTEADTIAALGYNDDVKEAYDLEFGIINMNNKAGKLAARKIYVKINGAEVLSYLDKNLKRELGTYVPVWSADGTDLVFESCTQKGYKLVSKNPTIYDLSQINGGIKGTDTKETQCLMIGSTKKSTNYAVRMKVKWNKAFTRYNGKRYDELKFGLGKKSTDTIWDQEGSGWHIALRPEQILIQTGKEEVLANVGCVIPKKTFTLEIGTYDIEIQKNGKKTGDYGRMIYVKIDGEEVASWLDQDLKRPLGKNVMVYATESTNATLSSLTSTTYLIRKKNTVADLYDACGLSEVQLNKNNLTKLGELNKTTQIALRTKVSYNKDSDEFKLALSKKVADNYWDVEASGWQFWFRPVYNQIFIGYGVTEYGAVIGYDFQNVKKHQFVLEIGERDVVYSTGKNYGREIYIKIDGEDVLTWIDTDYSRALGKYVTAWASQNSNVKLTSLTTKGYVPVDATAKINDIFDVGQYASVQLVNNECMNLGTMDSFKNQAIRMKVDGSKKTDEYKIAIGKVSDETIWDIEASGWQFWFRPVSNQIFIGYGVTEYAEVIGYEFPKSYTLEIGTRNVTMKNGKPYGLRIYIKINDEEVLSWIDTDTDRTVGKNVIAYASANADVTLSSLYQTKALPVTYRVDGKDTSSYKLIQAESVVVIGKDSKINLTIQKDPKVGLTLNDVLKTKESLKEVGVTKDVHTYLVTKPKNDDRIIVDLTTKKLRADTAEIYDFYDVAKEEKLVIKDSSDGYIGNVFKGNDPGGINTAMRFIVDTPKEGFNQIRVSYLGDSASLWSTSGFIMNLTNQKALIQLSSNQSTLAEGNATIIQPGKTLYVEVGAVKCYEEDVYKYDRWYVKVGESVEDMTLVVWFDSTQRGAYGSSVAAYGTDTEGADFTLRSLKKICTVADESADADKNRLQTIDRLGETGYAVYYPETFVAGDDISIKIYPQDGMSLGTLKVNGNIAKPKKTKDGGYKYDITGADSDVRFSYTIKKERSSRQ